ncbi:MAG: hypothetical protein N3A58_07520 [Spirochaetes bacterium]|nr:hypothetical protein [Spirochaetota bacterium]
MKIKNLIINKLISATSIKTIGDYTINPYKGCSFGCKYCYVINMKNIKEKNKWGNFVFVKENVDKILEKELNLILKEKKSEKEKIENLNSKISNRIIIGSSCDPYQPVELIMNSTRKIIDQIRKKNLPFFLMTKSPLLLKDLNIFSYNIYNRICFTINDDIIINNYERSYSKIMRFLTYFIVLFYDIDIYIHYGPFFPFFCDLKKFVEELIFYLFLFKNNFIPYLELNNRFEKSLKNIGPFEDKDIIFKNFFLLIKSIGFDFNCFVERIKNVKFEEIIKKIKINIEIINLKEIYKPNFEIIFNKMKNINLYNLEKFISVFQSKDNYDEYLFMLENIILRLKNEYGIKIFLLEREFDKFYSEDFNLKI